jgi:glyoxalase family protein
MSEKIAGLHHVTAIASDPQRNVDFYARVLGMRLVKRTVNFDDPGTYHFYFGDAAGRPGTLLTFFPWGGLPQGVRGTGEASVLALAVPTGSLDYWARRLGTLKVATTRAQRFGENVLAFTDYDGTRLELVELAGVDAASGWTGPVEASHAILGLHSIAVLVRDRVRTEALITDTLGLIAGPAEKGRHRFQAESSGLGTRIDVLESPDLPHARLGTGSIHHLAWRTRSDETQAEWLQRLARRGLHVTPVQDRQYFRSIYFREPGGVLFEIATEPPGFMLDESLELLGTELKLPAWLEPMRDRIESTLPPINVLEPQRSPGP